MVNENRMMNGELSVAAGPNKSICGTGYENQPSTGDGKAVDCSAMSSSSLPFPLQNIILVSAARRNWSLKNLSFGTKSNDF